MKRQSVTVIGAGVAGLCCALELSLRGVNVDVVERGLVLGDGSCSWQAGGMLAPWCLPDTTAGCVTTVWSRLLELDMMGNLLYVGFVLMANLLYDASVNLT